MVILLRVCAPFSVNPNLPPLVAPRWASIEYITINNPPAIIPAFTEVFTTNFSSFTPLDFITSAITIPKFKAAIVSIVIYPSKNPLINGDSL